MDPDKNHSVALVWKRKSEFHFFRFVARRKDFDDVPALGNVVQFDFAVGIGCCGDFCAFDGNGCARDRLFTFLVLDRGLEGVLGECNVSG